MRRWIIQVARALSRLLNAICHGEGDTTFSAYSAWLVLHGKTKRARWWGAKRCQFINALWDDDGHCTRAYLWHLKRDLFTWDDAG